MCFQVGTRAGIADGGRWRWRSKKKMNRARRREVEVDDDDDGEVARIFWKGRRKELTLWWNNNFGPLDLFVLYLSPFFFPEFFFFPI